MEFKSPEIPPYLVNEHYDDRYFDVIDAVVEAKHIYLDGCQIKEGIISKTSETTSFQIGEIGFGAGRVFVTLLKYLEDIGLKGLDIAFNSVELHPINSKRMATILEGFRPQVGGHIDNLVSAYEQIDITRSGWHQMLLDYEYGRVTLNLWVGEALEMVQALKEPCQAWFLDGHGPKKNPAMWRGELFQAIGKKTVPNGFCATFSVAGAVRRELAAAGFSVEKRPGLGRKSHVLKGIKLQKTP